MTDFSGNYTLCCTNIVAIVNIDHGNMDVDTLFVLLLNIVFQILTKIVFSVMASLIE